VGPRAILDAVKRKIPSPLRESNHRTPIVQPVDQRYTDWATSIPVIIGATGIVTKGLKQYLETIPVKHSTHSLQKESILGTLNIRKVLQSET
jgi:hypothetical protein